MTGRPPVRNEVQAYIQRAILTWTVSEEQRRQALLALSRDGFPLNRDARIRGGVLSATAYEIAAGGDQVDASRAGAITELYIAASFLLDDVMDDEVPQGSSVGVETALGITLLVIAEAELDEAVALPLPERIGLKLEAHRLILTACDGQLQEVNISGSPARFNAMDTEAALELTRRKAGSIGELAALIGAGIAAGPRADVTLRLRNTYSDLFTYIQLVDDLADAEGRASDIARARPTVPSIFYYRNAPGLGAGPEEPRQAPPHIIETGELRSTGTYLFTQLAAEMVRNKAIKGAEEIEQRYGGASTLLAVLGEASDSLEYGQAPSGAQASAQAP